MKSLFENSNSNTILYLVVFLAIIIYLVKISQPIYYFIFTSMLLVFYIISHNLVTSISVAGITTALVFVFLDKQPLKKRKSMLEGFASKKKSKGKKKRKSENFEPVLGDKMDKKESYLELFKSLKPAEINGLNQDTKDLIKTQKQLMETLQTMGPALKEGKSVLDTFKNYFNDSNLEKLTI